MKTSSRNASSTSYITVPTLFLLNGKGLYRGVAIAPGDNDNVRAARGPRGPMLDQIGIANRLLAAAPAADFERLAAHATVVDLVLGVDLILPHVAITHCWFPLSGLLSVITLDEDGGEAEVGLVGSDGMADIGTPLGDDCGVIRLLVQMAGTAVRIEAAALQKAMLASPALSRLLLAYTRAFSLQMAFSALAYARYSILCRLARWLLMASDRIGEREIAMTHDALSIMLGVRRAGVTVALRALAAQGLIDTVRGRIRIRDRAGLVAVAGGSYGAPEREYSRLLGRSRGG